MSRRSGWRVLSGLSLAVPFALFGSTGGHAAPSPVNQAYALSQNANQRVIVILRNQHSELSGRQQLAARAAAVHADQVPVLSQLSSVSAKNVQAFHVINAIDATVSSAEAAALRANPAVASVVPDMVMKRPASSKVDPDGIGSPAAGVGGHVTAPTQQLCGTASNPIENEALSLTNDLAARQQLRTPDGTQIDGSGVKVAYIADSIDPNNVDFFRHGDPSQPVITDYEDFNGDGAQQTEDPEAVGDAAMIAAQGNQAYDVSKASAVASSTAPPCYVKVTGMAPGASIMALRVFGAEPAFSGIFIRAIQYAVDNGADVLNESFGGNPYPNYGNDPISMADAAAIAAGVTVTVSSGDAGTTSTTGSPSTLQDVIEAGATTDMRSWEQVGYPFTYNGKGWLSNEIAPFSSAGISQNGQRTIDVVAPGDSDWASCTNCNLGFGGSATGLEWFGGTSEAAPITAGIAALVIQAYRSTHNGDNPSPGEVKAIIKSTATSLDYPSYIQGAGLVNAYKAIQAALSLPDSNGTPHPKGESFIYASHAGTSDPASTLFAAGYPGTPTSFSFQVTNTGEHPALIRPQLQTLGNLTATNTDVDYSSSNSTWALVPDTFGRSNAMGVTQYFNVPVGKQYLGVEFAWPNVIPNNNSRMRLTLFDPSGRAAFYSQPQGAGHGWGNVEVHDPQSGKWTAVIWEVGHRYLGPVHLTTVTGNMVPAGTVTPSASFAAVGQTVTFNVSTRLPASAGDQSDSISIVSLANGSIQTSVIPVALRSYLKPGSFAGTITGGNGRLGAPGDTKAYNFRVPAGTRDISLGISLADSNYNLEGVLVDPQGNPVNVQSTVTTQDANYNILGLTNTMQFFWANPTPGMWTYIQFVNGQASGRETQEPFTGTLQLNGVQVTLSGMPTTPQLPGTQFTAHVTVANTGNEPENFFVDPRHTWQASYGSGDGVAQYPNLYAGVLIPTDSTNVSFWSESLSGDQFDTELLGENGQVPYGFTGIPDVMGESTYDPTNSTWQSTVGFGNGVDSSVPAGLYLWDATLVGPWSGTSTGDTSAAVAVSGVFTTKAFDQYVCPSNGDFWAQFGPASTCPSYSTLTVQPGHSATIDVTFTVPPTTSSTVSGLLDVDTMNLSYQSPTGSYMSTSDGDILAHLQYSYPVQLLP